jgi:hypothetical protein
MLALSDHGPLAANAVRTARRRETSPSAPTCHSLRVRRCNSSARWSNPNRPGGKPPGRFGHQLSDGNGTAISNSFCGPLIGSAPASRIIRRVFSPNIRRTFGRKPVEPSPPTSDPSVNSTRICARKGPVGASLDQRPVRPHVPPEPGQPCDVHSGHNPTATRGVPGSP